MAATTVYSSPPPEITYDIDDGMYSVFDTIAAKGISAYADAVDGPQNLRLEASSNLSVTAVQGVQVYSSNAFQHYLVSTSNGNRLDTLAFSVHPSQSPSNAYAAAQLAGTTFYDSDEYSYIGSTRSNGFKVNQPMLINGRMTVQQNQVVGQNLTVGHLADFGSNMLVRGHVYGMSLNVWKDKGGITDPLDIDRIGYGLQVANDDNLEIVRYVRFHDSNSPFVTQRIASFGTGRLLPTSSSDANSNLQISLDGFYGLDIIEGGSGGQIGTSNAPVTIMSEWSTNSAGHIFHNSSRVGIGTDDPQYTCHVGGDLAASNIMSDSLGVTSLYMASDRRLKTVSGAADTALCLQKLLAIGVQNYTLNADPAKKLHTGFIAQQVEEVDPNAVTIRPLRTDIEDCRFLDTNALLGIAYGAIQAQSAQIARLAAELDSLKARLAA